MPRTVLCADDSTTIQKVVELTFAGTDMRVLCVSDGDAAIRVFRQERPDLVLLDVIMPLRTGYEVCEFIKREGGASAPPVILLSSTFDPYDAERARASGADAHLPKPFEARALLRRVNELLARPAASARPAAPAPPDSAPPPGRPTVPAAPPVPAAPAAPAAPSAAATDPPLAPARGGPGLAPEDVDAIAHRVVQLMGHDVVKEIAWEVVPDLVDMVMRRRLEAQDPGSRKKG